MINRTLIQPGGGGNGIGGNETPDVSFYRNRGTGLYESWYPAGLIAGATTATTPVTRGRLMAMPFIEVRGGILDRIAFRCGGVVAGTVARVGLYSNVVGSLYPDALLADGGEQDTAVVGNKLSVINVSLSANTPFWVVFIGGGGAADPQILTLGNDGISPVLGWSSNLQAPITHLAAVVAYGALPAVFPAGAAAAVQAMPGVLLRYSA